MQENDVTHLDSAAAIVTVVMMSVGSNAHIREVCNFNGDLFISATLHILMLITARCVISMVRYLSLSY